MRKYQEQGGALARLTARIGKKIGVSEGDILKRSRGGMGAAGRKAVAYLGHRVLGIPVVEIALYFNVTGPAVSRCLEDGGAIVKKYRLNKLIN